MATGWQQLLSTTQKWGVNCLLILALLSSAAAVCNRSHPYVGFSKAFTGFEHQVMSGPIALTHRICASPHCVLYLTLRLGAMPLGIIIDDDVLALSLDSFCTCWLGGDMAAVL